MEKIANFINNNQYILSWLPPLLLILCMGVLMNSCANNVRIIDTSVLYKKCQEAGGTLVDTTCYKTIIDLDVD